MLKLCPFWPTRFAAEEAAMQPVGVPHGLFLKPLVDRDEEKRGRERHWRQKTELLADCGLLLLTGRELYLLTPLGPPSIQGGGWRCRESTDQN